MMKEQGASLRDHATHEPNPAVSALRVGIVSAVNSALKPMKGWAEGRLYGSPAEKIIWNQYFSDAPEVIAMALHDAGYTLVRMGGRFPVQVSQETPEHRFRTEFRVQMEVRPAIFGCSYRLDERYAADLEFRRQVLPRQLAKQLLHEVEGMVAEDIAKAMSASGQDPQGLEAKPASAVLEENLPKGTMT